MIKAGAAFEISERASVLSETEPGDVPICRLGEKAMIEDNTINSSSFGSPITDPPFNPANFPVVPPKRFDDLQVGDVFRAPSRTLTNALTLAFQAVSADNNPLHYDDHYAKQRGKKAALVVPMEVLSFSVPGASLFSLYVGEVLIAWTEVSAKFLKESFVGDTIYSEIRIANLEKKENIGHVTTDIIIHNQRGELVISGNQKFTLRL